MKNKKTMLTMLLVIAALCMASLVAASTIFIVPTDGSIVTGDINVTINTTDFNTDGLVNCTVTFTSSLSEATMPPIQFLNHTNASADQLYANGTLNTTSVADATDFSLGGSCTNASGESQSITTITLTVDNTVPVITALAPADETVYTTNAQRTAIAFSATAANATACTLFIDTFSHTMAESSDSCTYTKDFLNDQVHNWYLTATDGTNVTTSSTIQLHITTPGGGGNNAGSSGTIGGSAGGSGSGGTGTAVGFGTFVLLAVGGYLWLNRGGSSSGSSGKSRRSAKKR